MTKKEKISLGILLIILIALPHLGLSSFILRIITMIGLYTIFAHGLNIITGYTGQVSIGHGGFCAIGGYTSALLNVSFGTNFFISSLAGMALAGVAAFLIGLPTLRLSGTYFTIVTLGFGEIIRMLALNMEWLTGGPLGVSDISRPMIGNFEMTTFNGGLYYLCLFLLIMVTLFVNILIRSKVGRAFMAIRDDELVARFMGINTFAYKLLSFVISGMIAGLGGSFYAHLVRFIDPNTFNFDISILIISIVILGGMGTIKGMFLGSALLVSFPEILRFASEYRFIIYGFILVLMIRYKPEGLLGGQSKSKYQLPKEAEEGKYGLESANFES